MAEIYLLIIIQTFRGKDLLSFSRVPRPMTGQDFIRLIFRHTRTEDTQEEQQFIIHIDLFSLRNHHP